MQRRHTRDLFSFTLCASAAAKHDIVLVAYVRVSFREITEEASYRLWLENAYSRPLFTAVTICVTLVNIQTLTKADNVLASLHLKKLNQLS